MILNFKNISKTYIDINRNTPVLNNTNIKLKSERISLIMGSSGVGKSTLLNIVGCLLKPDIGYLSYNNKTYDLSKDRINNFRIKNFSYIFQNFNLLPEFNIYDNLLIPSYINNINIEDSKKRISELLTYMNLEYLKYSFPDQISYGEAQRIAFIRSLIGKQKYIIADEPSGNLDEINTKIILDLIININKEFKYTFIIASHDKSFIDIADDIYLIKKGKIIKNNE